MKAHMMKCRCKDCPYRAHPASERGDCPAHWFISKDAPDVSEETKRKAWEILIGPPSLGHRSSQP